MIGKLMAESLWEQRQREKAASRKRDEEDLALGRKTPEQLALENGAFAFPPGRIRIRLPRREK